MPLSSFLHCVRKVFRSSTMGSKLESQQGLCPESPAASQEELGLYLYLGKDNLTRYLLTQEELNDNKAERLQTQSEIRTLYQCTVFLTKRYPRPSSPN